MHPGILGARTLAAHAQAIDVLRRFADEDTREHLDKLAAMPAALNGKDPSLTVHLQAALIAELAALVDRLAPSQARRGR